MSSGSDPSPRPGGWRGYIAWAIVLIGLTAALRLARPGADPSLDFGAAHLSDEGYYCKNAKEWHLSGRWIWRDDNHNHVFLAPLTVGLYAAAFAAAGPSLPAARAAAALVGILLVVAGAALARRAWGRQAAGAALVLLGVAPSLVYLSRVALAEGPALLAALGFTAAMASDLGRRRVSWRPALAYAVALLAKASAPLLGLCGVIALLLDGLSRRQLRAALGRCLHLAGWLVGVTALWYLCAIRPWPLAAFMFDQEFVVHVGGEGMFGPAGALWSSLRLQHPAFGLVGAAAVAGLGLLACLLLAAEAGAGRSPDPLEVAAAGWLVGQALFFSLAPYQPPRYFAGLAAPAALLAARLLGDPAAALTRIRACLPGSPGIVGTAALATAALGAAAALRAAGTRPAWLCLAGAAVGFWLVARLARPAPALALALVAAQPLVASLAPLSRPRHTIAQAAADLAGRLDPDDVVVGFFADSLALASPARTVVIHGRWNPGADALRRFGATWLLVADDELQWLVDRDPNLAVRLALAATYAPQDGARGRLRLYSLGPTNPSPGVPGPGPF